MERLISLQAAIDFIDAGRLVNPNEPRWSDNEVVAFLKSRPSAQPEQRWIPCSERLPDENGRYLVTRGLNAAGAIWNRVYIVNYSDLMELKDSRIFWQGNVGKSDFEELEDVVAWMPLPESYRGE